MNEGKAKVLRRLLRTNDTPRDDAEKRRFDNLKKQGWTPAQEARARKVVGK